MQQLTETHHLVIKVYPVIHFAKLYIANHVIHSRQPSRLGFILDRSISWCEFTFVICPVDKDMQCFTIGVNGGAAIDAMVIFFFVWGPCRFPPTGCGGLPRFFN